MDDIDYYAMSTADKTFVIFFIITIILTNVHLIFKLVRQQGFRYRPKSLVLISLAFGDIFLALFPLPLMAKVIFEGGVKLSCSTRSSVHTYFYYLIHFVYGVGLITLAVELSLRHRGQPALSNTSRMKGFAYSAVPWFLGLIIVLPLKMEDMNYYICYLEDYTISRLIAALVISVMIPAILSVIACSIVYRKKFDAGQNQYNAITVPGSTPGVILSTQNTAYVFQQNPDSEVPPPAGQAPYIQPAYPTQNFQQQNMYPQSQTQPPYNQYPTQNVQQQNMYPPAVQYSPPPYPATEQVNQTNVVIPAPNYQFQAQNATALPVEDPSKEKKILLIAAIIYSMCVLPYATYTIVALYYYNGSSTDTFLMKTFTWMMIFRSLVTPSIFASSLKK